MNNKTRIIVIHFKELLIGAIIALLLIIFTILAICAFAKNKGENKKSESALVSASAMNDNIDSSQTDINSDNSETDNDSKPMFCPGVYTSSIQLNGTPIDIQVTVDANNINSIELVNLSSSITTMYPMLTSSFDEISAKVIEKGSTNITYDSSNRYTYSLLLNAITSALNKAKTD